MNWEAFFTEVCQCLDKPRNAVELVFRFDPGPHTFMHLANQEDWNDAMSRMCEKANAAQVKNMLEANSAPMSGAHGATSRKGKCLRKDDIPPSLSEATKRQFSSLVLLQAHLRCQIHTGKYCLVRPTGQPLSMGHYTLKNEEMTLWAKLISEGKATKDMPPNILSLDYPSTKKARRTNIPDVHIAVNISPGNPLASAGTLAQASYVVSDAPTATPPDAKSMAGDANIPTHAPSALPAPVPLGLLSQNVPAHSASVGHSYMLILVDCMDRSRLPHIRKLIWLMECDGILLEGTSLELMFELMEHGIDDAVDIYSLPLEILATFGNLSMRGASQFHLFTQAKLLGPLGLLQTEAPHMIWGADIDIGALDDTPVAAMGTEVATESAGGAAEPSGQFVMGEPTLTTLDKGKAREMKQESHEVVLDWIDGIEEVNSDGEEEIDEIDDSDELASDDEVAPTHRAPSTEI
ncbi:hypothetical protein BC834DRAFT_847191 [Gloeopeniophorella convolvens]|nr:hypothetical protein BC834DRAFT_847191 [Gloeopeniophorella convolvens]